jgi:hypothetical protein
VKAASLASAARQLPSASFLLAHSGKVLTAVAFAALLLQCLSATLWITEDFSADWIVPLLFARDVWAGELMGWHPSTAPGFFPSYLFLVLLEPFGMRPILAHAVHYLFIVLSELLLLWVLVRGSGQARPSFALLCAGMTFFLFTQQNFISPYLLSAIFHSSPLWCGLAILALLKTRATGGAGSWTAWSSWIISTLALLSDLLFVLQVLVPLLAVLLLQCLRSASTRKSLMPFVWGLAASIPTFLIIQWVSEYVGLFHFNPVLSGHRRMSSPATEIPDRLWMLAHAYLVWAQSRGWLGTGVTAMASIVLLMAIPRALRRLRTTPFHFTSLFVLYSALAMVITQGVVTATWKLDDAPAASFSYAGIVPALPILATLVIVVSRSSLFGARFLAIAPKTVIAVCILVTSGFFGRSSFECPVALPGMACAARRLASAPYREVISCVQDQLEGHQLRMGFGDYWTARVLKLLLPPRFLFTQVTPSLHVFNFLTRDSWPEQQMLGFASASRLVFVVRTSMPEGRRTVFAHQWLDLFPETTLHEQQVLREIGTPSLRVDECEGLSFLVYEGRSPSIVARINRGH